MSQKFLARLGDTSEELKVALANMCVTIHTSVLEMADRFFNQLRRRYYITPKSYLDLISLYMSLLGEKRWGISAVNRYLSYAISRLLATAAWKMKEPPNPYKLWAEVDSWAQKKNEKMQETLIKCIT